MPVVFLLPSLGGCAQDNRTRVQNERMSEHACVNTGTIAIGYERFAATSARRYQRHIQQQFRVLAPRSGQQANRKATSQVGRHSASNAAKHIRSTGKRPGRQAGGQVGRQARMKEGISARKAVRRTTKQPCIVEQDHEHTSTDF